MLKGAGVVFNDQPNAFVVAENQIEPVPADANAVYLDFKAKYVLPAGKMVVGNPALIIELERQILNESNKEMDRQEKRLKEIDKQNKKTKENVKYIRERLYELERHDKTSLE